MSFVIRIVAPADGSFKIHRNFYIQDFEIEPSPHGTIHLTTLKWEAKKFEDAVAAMDFWKTQNGTRPDGKPNRPLTAYTVEILEDK